MGLTKSRQETPRDRELREDGRLQGWEEMRAETVKQLREDTLSLDGRRARFESAAVADERARIAAALRALAEAGGAYSLLDLASLLEEGRL